MNPLSVEAAARSPARLLPWLLAILPILLALVLQQALTELFHPSIWLLFYPAVFLSSWLAGLLRGVVASALATASVLWFLLPPLYTFVKPPGHYLGAGIFFTTGVFFALLNDRLRTANQRIGNALVASELANEAVRRAREDERHTSEALAALFEQAPDGVFVADFDGRYTDVNHAGCAMLGYTRQEIIGKTIVDLIPARDVERLWQARQHLAAGGTDVSEWALRRKDGTFVTVEVSARILSDGRWQAVARDIGERKRLQAALVASHEDLNRAQSVVKVGSWRVDLRTGVLYWSDETHRILGVPLGTQLTEELFFACVHPDDLSYVRERWAAALRGDPYDIEHRVIADGTIKWLREKADLEFDEHHAAVGGTGIVQDITERKWREQELREAQEHLDLAVRGASLATWDWDIAAGEVVFNARWAELRGCRPEDIAGDVDARTAGIHPEDWPRVQQALEDVLQGRSEDYDVEHRVETRTGEWIWVRDRGKVFARGERGQPLRMAGTQRDVTEQKQAEQALRLAEAQSSGVLAISADAIISVDEEQRITMYNDGAERMFGYSRAEAIGSPLDMLIPERFRARHRAHVERFARSGDAARRMGASHGTICGRRKNGDEFPADGTISRLAVDGKRILTVALRDVTEERRVEYEQRFLAEVGPVLASSLDYEETLTKVAELAVRDLADFCIVEIFDDEEIDRPTVAARDPDKAWLSQWLTEIPLDRNRPRLLHCVLDSGQSSLLPEVTEEMIASFAQNAEHLRAFRAADVRSLLAVPLVAHEQVLGAIAFLSSKHSRIYGPSDLRLAEELGQRAALAILNARLYRAASRATRDRDDVLGIVAHDLRNPLHNIILQLSAVRRRGAESRRLAQCVEVIDRAATRMNRLIEDLLDVTCMEAGRLHVEGAPLSADRIVRDAVDAQSPIARAAALELRTEIAGELVDVWADRDRLLQVFENLLANAVKFTGRGGVVTVGARRSDGEILFWVGDSGDGIPPEDLPHLFDRFWQARQHPRIGAGLGLPIVKGLVEAHGGRIWVESTVGRGTTFFFTIPTALATQRRSPADPHAA